MIKSGSNHRYRAQSGDASPVPSCAQKYRFDTLTIHEVLNTSLEVSMHVLDMQVIASIHIPNKISDFRKIIGAVEEECEHARQPYAADALCFTCQSMSIHDFMQALIS